MLRLELFFFIFIRVLLIFIFSNSEQSNTTTDSYIYYIYSSHGHISLPIHIISPFMATRASHKHHIELSNRNKHLGNTMHLRLPLSLFFVYFVVGGKTKNSEEPSRFITFPSLPHLFGSYKEHGEIEIRLVECFSGLTGRLEARKRKGRRFCYAQAGQLFSVAIPLMCRRFLLSPLPTLLKQRERNKVVSLVLIQVNG